MPCRRHAGAGHRRSMGMAAAGCQVGGMSLGRTAHAGPPGSSPRSTRTHGRPMGASLVSAGPSTESLRGSVGASLSAYRGNRVGGTILRPSVGGRRQVGDSGVHGAGLSAGTHPEPWRECADPLWRARRPVRPGAPVTLLGYGHQRSRSSYYRWKTRLEGPARPRRKRRAPNALRESERRTILEQALAQPHLSARQLAVRSQQI
jgi:hypothetical protein